jgi:excisionase family DNA binding protein
MSTKKTRTHTTLQGRELTFEEPTGELAKFLKRVEEAAANPKATEDDLIALVHSNENPILDTSILPGRGMVTPRVFALPIYHVMNDLIARAAVRAGHVDLEAAAAQFTMTPTEAAEHLGVHVSAVRQAIDRGALSAWRKGARWFLNPRDVDNYKVSDTGPQGGGAELQVFLGRSKDGAQFIVKAPDRLVHVKRTDGNEHRGTIGAGWKRIGVFAANGDNARFFVLEPADEEGAEIVCCGFYLRGKFRTITVENNAKRARAASKNFRAA